MDSGTAASCLKVQQIALVNVMWYSSPKPPPNFLSKSDLSAICRISSETKSTKRIADKNLILKKAFQFWLSIFHSQVVVVSFFFSSELKVNFGLVKNIHVFFYCFSIAGIYPRASSKERAHSSQSDNSRYPCTVVFTSPLTSRLCSQLQELQELPTSP